jgi:hypothetical protein
MDFLVQPTAAYLFSPACLSGEFTRIQFPTWRLAIPNTSVNDSELSTSIVHALFATFRIVFVVVSFTACIAD